MTYSVAIAGASGYVGGELMRLVAQHPELELRTVTANSSAGEKVFKAHPHLQQYSELEFSETSAATLSGHDVVFLALPHAKSAEVADYLSPDALVIDCGADFRLIDPNAWRKFYQTEHAGSWPYGLPELIHKGGAKQRKQLPGVKRVAVPGCNVTAISLGLAPGLASGLFQSDDLVSVLSVGTSGAGKSAQTKLQASEIHGSASAYGVGGVHRHTPEIEQNLALAAGEPVAISFTPVLVPMSRGILAVNTARVTSGTSESSLRSAYQAAYQDEHFVKVLPPGEFPSTAATLGANTALVGLTLDEHSGRAVVVVAIDNLVKGTAGAAIQSLNIALGIFESTGLTTNGVAP